jgi:hypothetical protein
MLLVAGCQLMDSQDVGVRIPISAKAALKLDSPTRGVVSLTSTST